MVAITYMRVHAPGVQQSIFQSKKIFVVNEGK
jgi:hypothetical protein